MKSDLEGRIPLELTSIIHPVAEQRITLIIPAKGNCPSIDLELSNGASGNRLGRKSLKISFLHFGSFLTPAFRIDACTDPSETK